VTTAAARALLARLVDYAGLFPPAGLGMAEAAAEFARARRSPEAFVLGRFVAPAARLAELAEHAEPHLGVRDLPWRVSALLGDDVAADARHLIALPAQAAGLLLVEAVELRATSPEQAEAALDAVPLGLPAFVELAPGIDPDPVLGVLKRRGERAKIRTGGVTPDAIPTAGGVAALLVRCARARVPFKATAGLHHALRAERALTYAEDAPRATMHGFLNVFAAAALAQAGASEADVEEVLNERDPGAFRIDEAALIWRGRLLAAQALSAMRGGFALSFGSCSFAEPIADLRELGFVATPAGPPETPTPASPGAERERA
jgi:hypothetical protein